mmetsp:Transcript_8673/g.23233  ORF Transcript_8673/g.23233 Transcript_8673/m.23233 type:complete len:702 (-) Transcript_8673:423-2528(-)
MGVGQWHVLRLRRRRPCCRLRRLRGGHENTVPRKHVLLPPVVQHVHKNCSRLTVVWRRQRDVVPLLRAAVECTHSHLLVQAPRELERLLRAAHLRRVQLSRVQRWHGATNVHEMARHVECLEAFLRHDLRHRPAQREVSLGTSLDRLSFHGNLVAVVQARNSARKQEERVCKHDVAPFVELAGDARDVVVAQKRQQREARVQRALTKQRVTQLVVIAVVERAPDGLLQLVVGSAVEQVVVSPRVVVAVDELANQDGVWLSLLADMAEFRPKFRLNLVRNVEAPSVDSHFREPVTRDVEDVLAHRAMAVVQSRQAGVTFPAVERESHLALANSFRPCARSTSSNLVEVLLRIEVRVPVDCAPSGEVGRARADVVPLAEMRLACTVDAQVDECVVVHTRVVEHAVEHNTYAALVQLVNNFLEERVVAEPAIYREVVERVVPVRVSLEDRAEVDGGDAKLLKVVVVVANERKAWRDRRVVRQIGEGRVEETLGVYVVEHSLLRPLRHVHILGLLIFLLCFRSFRILLVARGDWISLRVHDNFDDFRVYVLQCGAVHLGGGNECPLSLLVDVPAVPPVVDGRVAVCKVRGNDAVCSTLPVEGPLLVPTAPDDVLVLDDRARRQRDFRGPHRVRRFDKVHGNGVQHVPIAELDSTSDEAEVVSEGCGNVRDVERDPRGVVGVDARSFFLDGFLDDARRWLLIFFRG